MIDKDQDILDLLHADDTAVPLPVDPIIVKDNPGVTAVRSAGSDVLIVAAALPIVIKLLGAHDLTGILQFLQSSQGATVAAIVLPVLATGWRSLRARRKKIEKVILAHGAPDEVGIVVP